MEKSTKILIGVGVVAIVGLLVYKKAKATPSLTNSGTIPKKPITKPSVPSNPIIDPNTGKLTPPETKDTTDPNTNPKFDTGGSGGSGAKGGGGSAGGPNNPDLNSGKFSKVDPNKKDENWIKALQKKQQKGGESKKGKKPTPKVDCSVNPYDPTCQKIKDCYYSPSDPSCSYGEYDYSYGDDSAYDYSGYDNNKYDYSYDDGGDYSGYDYNTGGGGYYYGGGADYEGGYFGGGYFYSGNYGYTYDGGFGAGDFGRGGNPSDFDYS